MRIKKTVIMILDSRYSLVIWPALYTKILHFLGFGTKTHFFLTFLWEKVKFRAYFCWKLNIAWCVCKYFHIFVISLEPAYDEKDKDMDKQLKEREAKIIELAVGFCNEHLDEECAMLCTKLVQKLGQKHVCPFQSGKVETWAAGVVYTICSINLLFSKKYRLKISSTDISDYFGGSVSTISKKMREIKELLNINPVFDTEFILKEMAERYPLSRLRVKTIMANLFSKIKKQR